MKILPLNKRFWTITANDSPNGIEISLEEYRGLTEGRYRITEDLTGIEHTPQNELNVREKNERIKELKARLTATDYQSHKYADGVMTEEEFAPIRIQRQVWRDEINILEQEIMMFGGEV